MTPVSRACAALVTLTSLLAPACAAEPLPVAKPVASVRTTVPVEPVSLAIVVALPEDLSTESTPMALSSSRPNSVSV